MIRRRWAGCGFPFLKGGKIRLAGDTRGPRSGEASPGAASSFMNVFKTVLNPHLSRAEIIFLVSLMLILACLYISGLNSWKYSIIGDEYAFLTAARNFLNEGFFSHPWSYWIKMSGVYGDVPVFTTVYQALAMKIFGQDNFGWRLSMTLLTLACVLPFYLTLRHIVSEFSQYPKISTALGCIAFFLSEMIIVWARIGKPCNAALVTPVFAIFFFYAAKRSSWFYLLAGLTCGFGVYLYMLGPSVAVGVIGGLLLGRIGLEVVKQRRLLWFPPLLMAAGFLLVATPGLSQIEFLQHSVAKHVFRPQGNPAVWTLKKYYDVLTLPYTYPAHAHFLKGRVVDPITAYLLLPFALTLLRRERGRGPLATMLWMYAAFAFVTGAIDKYPRPSETRVFLLMYPIAFLAAAGFDGLFVWRRKTPALLLAVVCGILVAGYNWGKLEFYNPYHRQVPEDMHVIRQIQESPPEMIHVILSPRGHIGFLERRLEFYGYEDRVKALKIPEDIPNQLDEVLGSLTRSGVPVSVVVLWTRSTPPEVARLCTLHGVLLESPIPKAAIPQRKTGTREK